MTQLLEYIKMALKNIAANKGRTILTMLGIVIGISSVILILSIGNGATNMITSTLDDATSGTLTIQLREYEDQYYITADDIEGIRELEGVKAVAALEYWSGKLRTKRGEFDTMILTANEDGMKIQELEFERGSTFTDAKAGQSLCVITENDAMKLFGSTNVVGKEIEASLEYWDIPFNMTICGVAKSEENSAMVEALMTNMPIYMYTHPRTITKAVGYDFKESYTEITVLKEDDTEGKEVVERIINYLEVQHRCKGKDVYANQSFEDFAKTFNNVIKVITIFVAFVASVSLLVGGIGVMNIMLVSVTERTREIGIRKALGAKTGSITVQFLAESAFITLLGGLIGILFGIVGAKLIASVIGAMVPEMKFSPMLSVSMVIGTTLFSSGVGILFGVYPARKAAKLSPIEALRHN